MVNSCAGCVFLFPVFLYSPPQYFWGLFVHTWGGFLPVHPVLSGSWSCSTTSPIIPCSASIWCNLFPRINTGAPRAGDKHVFLEQPSQWKLESGYLKVSLTHTNRTQTQTHKNKVYPGNWPPDSVNDLLRVAWLSFWRPGWLGDEKTPLAICCWVWRYAMLM